MSVLFTPLTLRSMTLPNRIVLPAMVTRLSGEDGDSPSGVGLLSECVGVVRIRSFADTPGAGSDGPDILGFRV